MVCYCQFTPPLPPYNACRAGCSGLEPVRVGIRTRVCLLKPCNSLMPGRYPQSRRLEHVEKNRNPHPCVVLGLGIRGHPRLDLYTRGGAHVAIMPRNVAGSGNLHPSSPRAACMYAAKCCCEWESVPIRACWSCTHSSLQNDTTWPSDATHVGGRLVHGCVVGQRGELIASTG